MAPNYMQPTLCLPRAPLRPQRRTPFASKAPVPMSRLLAWQLRRIDMWRPDTEQLLKETKKYSKSIKTEKEEPLIEATEVLYEPDVKELEVQEAPREVFRRKRMEERMKEWMKRFLFPCFSLFFHVFSSHVLPFLSLKSAFSFQTSLAASRLALSALAFTRRRRAVEPEPTAVEHYDDTPEEEPETPTLEREEKRRRVIEEGDIL